MLDHLSIVCRIEHIQKAIKPQQKEIEMQTQVNVLGQDNRAQLDVAIAQEQADQARTEYQNNPTTANLIEHRRLCRIVFNTRFEYLWTLVLEITTNLTQEEIQELIKGAKPKYLINVNHELYTFELTETATGAKYNGFDSVESYLINLLNNQ